MRFSVDQKVLFKHCDPAGIVFYPRYFEMINDTVEAFFNEIGAPFETLHKSAAVPTVQISTTFQAPSRHGDHLVISLHVLRIGTSSLDLAVQAHCGDEARFGAQSTLVYINASARAEPWPTPLRAALSAYLEDRA